MCGQCHDEATAASTLNSILSNVWPIEAHMRTCRRPCWRVQRCRLREHTPEITTHPQSRLNDEVLILQLQRDTAGAATRGEPGCRHHTRRHQMESTCITCFDSRLPGADVCRSRWTRCPRTPSWSTLTRCRRCRRGAARAPTPEMPPQPGSPRTAASPCAWSATTVRICWRRDCVSISEGKRRCRCPILRALHGKPVRRVRHSGRF